MKYCIHCWILILKLTDAAEYDAAIAGLGKNAGAAAHFLYFFDVRHLLSFRWRGISPKLIVTGIFMTKPLIGPQIVLFLSSASIQ
jgi:hypothetical protein